MIKEWNEMNSIVKNTQIAKNRKNNQDNQEIETGQGNGVHLPQTDGAVIHRLDGLFLVEKLSG
jgi:hypothetical protein